MITRQAIAPAHDGALLSTTDLMRLLRKSRATLYRWMDEGLLPRPRLIRNSAYWNREEIAAALERVAPGLYGGSSTVVRNL